MAIADGSEAGRLCPKPDLEHDTNSLVPNRRKEIFSSETTCRQMHCNSERDVAGASMTRQGQGKQRGIYSLDSPFTVEYLYCTCEYKGCCGSLSFPRNCSLADSGASVIDVFVIYILFDISDLTSEEITSENHTVDIPVHFRNMAGAYRDCVLLLVSRLPSPAQLGTSDRLAHYSRETH